MNKRLNRCPSCNQTLQIVEYRCPHCDINIRGSFEIGELASLSQAQLEFIKVFLCSGGNIREVEKRLKISYPTVKGRLTEIQQILCGSTNSNRQSALTRLETGELSVDEAIEEMRRKK
ncbi:MAG: DUF2089 domain-containing protein [Candidatus Cloacimonetes bacterium]|nr:DUF2089 domain-containing protein [Candidatus Cloacimonadota bacterium]